MNKKRITLSDIAKEVGVSPAAVSMALSNRGGVSEKTARKVVEVARKLGYVYDRGAASMRTGRSDTVGVFVGTIQNSFFGELVSGVDDAMTGTNKISYLMITHEDVERQTKLLSRIREQGVDGIIICSAPGTPPDMLKQLREWGVPAVQLLRSISRNAGDLVSTDYQHGVELICAHLLALGHRSFTFLGGALQHSASELRIKGFARAMDAAGLPKNLVFRTQSDGVGGRQGVRQALASGGNPTAFVCFNDLVAIGAMAELQAAGMQPGKDCAVVGVDNTAAAAQSNPALTTMDTHAREIGLEAGRLLLRRIANPRMANEHIIIPSKLVIRQSSGMKVSAENLEGGSTALSA
ncbi:MAG: LacI family DNA-binding transcriptional regulator [Rhodobacteraceae bacterium]|nr:LacI family DNA-binding transcriptional regulator [Paracoccaceae bacterium]